MKFKLQLVFAFFACTNVIAQEINDTTYIYFPFDKHHLTSEAIREADKFIADYKDEKQNASIIIKGFCDAIGTDDYNDKLSEKRTISVQDYLVQNGIPVSSIVIRKGYGEREPINSNSTAEERQQNRRVEIIWSKKDATTAAPQQPLPEPNTDPVITPPTVKNDIPEFSKTTIDSVKEGQVLRLRNINFYGGRHTFLPQATPALEELLEVMKSNPKLVIEIHGHICCIRGARDGIDYDAGDNKLSLNRAKAVYKFLLDNGIHKRRMSYKAFGGQFPLIDPELSEADRTMNRRVEIKIIKK